MSVALQGLLVSTSSCLYPGGSLEKNHNFATEMSGVLVTHKLISTWGGGESGDQRQMQWLPQTGPGVLGESSNPQSAKWTLGKAYSVSARFCNFFHTNGVTFFLFF